MRVVTAVLDTRATRYDEYFIVETHNEGFVQFRFDETCIKGEAKGGAYFLPPDEMGERQMHLLELLGCDGPGETYDEPEYDHHNYFRRWPLDTPSAEIADDLLRALTLVYMSQGEGELLELKWGSFSACRVGDWDDCLSAAVR